MSFNYKQLRWKFAEKMRNARKKKNKELEEIDKSMDSEKEKKIKRRKVIRNFKNKIKRILENPLYKRAKQRHLWEVTYINNGVPRYKKIPPEDARKAAGEYGEWYQPLIDFLEICIINGIVTTSSCAGHLENNNKWSYSYVSFDISDNRTKKLVEFVVKNKLANCISINKDDENWEELCVLTMYVDLDYKDLFYKACIKKLSEIIQENESEDNLKKDTSFNNNSQTLIRKLITISSECKKEHKQWLHQRWIISFYPKNGNIYATDDVLENILNLGINNPVIKIK